MGGVFAIIMSPLWGCLGFFVGILLSLYCFFVVFDVFCWYIVVVILLLWGFDGVLLKLGYLYRVLCWICVFL